MINSGVERCRGEAVGLSGNLMAEVFVEERVLEERGGW